MNSNKMKAIVATGYGSPSVFELQNVEKPQPKKNEVLVKVMSAAATTADTMIRTGKPYFGRLFIGLTKPKHAIPGTGFSGVVEQVGQEVSTFTVGDNVFGETTFSFGTNAEYVAVKADGVVLKKPENMSHAEAAGYCDGHLTSYNFLNVIAKINKGDKVLINGAAGSLGTSAVQLAKYYGAHVTAVCSGKNEGLVRSLGADEVIDYTQEDFTKGTYSFDFIYDTLGKSTFSKCKNVLAAKGLYLSPVLKFPLLVDMIKTSFGNKKKAKFEATGTNSEEKLRGMLEQVVEIFKTGKLKTVIDRQFPLEKLAEAHSYIDSGHKKGNVVIVNA